MARKTTKSSGTQSEPEADQAIQTDAETAETDVTDGQEPATEGETAADTDTVDAETTDAGSTPEPEQDEDREQAPVAATPSTMDHPEPQPSGSGFVPLLIGGLLAGGIGFVLGYFALFNAPEDPRLTEVAGSLQTQSEDIAALGDQTRALEDSIASIAPPEVDLSGIETSLSELGDRIGGLETRLDGFADRIGALEDRPVFSGEAGADEAAMAAAIDQLRAELAAEQDASAAMAGEIRAMADEAAAAIADAQASMAEAEARAEATVNAATARAALSELRIAIASGAPFAEPLAAVAEAQGLDVPPAISSVADTGVPTLAEIEASFPAAARAALPVALQATAGDTAGERLGAFLRSQVGGRALEPQPGDDPDAILSRSAAAVATGDLQTALAELTALPDPAIEAMETWVEQAASRMAALEALDGLTAALGGN